MNKRDYKRMNVDIKISFNLWNPLFWKKEYNGVIKNISEKGLFISTVTPNFPDDALLEIYLLADKEIIFIPAKNNTIIRKTLLSEKSCDSIGVTLLNPPKVYNKFLQRLKTIDKLSDTTTPG
jgi:hypothetical protein